ncbi:MAG: type I glutamate--ammonia ligase [Clostridiales bacterium]|nr:type I glutamate--ammonia ligase [Clostridiales bacterium]
MAKYTKNDILRMAEEEDVEFIRLQFTDMFGTMKNIAIPIAKLEKAVNNECVIDASSIESFYRNEEEDMYLHPELDTFCILPWRPQQGKVARLICDIYRADGTPYKGSPRYILKQVVRQAEEMGYSFKANPECEFFLFHTDDNGRPTTLTHEQAGYMDLSPVDLGENARRDIVLTLEDMGYDVESSHHEISPAQHEIDFSMADVMETADKFMTFKVAVRTVAKRHGLHATFMPKPREEVNGSGMHINMALYKNGKNIFEDRGDALGLSREAYSFIAGIFAHIKGMTAFFNPLVNSYKRLVPGFEAPSDITWSSTQRTALIKVCQNRRRECQIELRSPDPSANPYLVFALCLAAGIQGIEEKLQLSPELKVGIRELSEEEKLEQGIQSLPTTLNEALNELSQDEWIAGVVGSPFLECYMKSKRKEWKSYEKQVSEWELTQYLYQI